MKKIFGMALLSTVVLTLAGCGPKESNESAEASKSESKELLVWEDQAKASGIEDAVAKFEKEHDVKVKVIEKAYGGQLEDLRLDGPAGTGPDVITIPGDQIGTAVTEGLIKELDIKDDLKKIYNEAAMESQTVEGKVYGLPKAVETQILYYNKAIVTKDQLPKTTDEWLEFSKKQVASGKEKYGLLALWDQLYYAQGVFDGYGGYIFGKDDKDNYNPDDLGIASDGSMEAANYIQKFYSEKVFPAGIIGEQGINVLDSLFQEGKAAAVISGPWSLDPYKEAGIDYGVVELPMLPNGKHMGSLIGVKSYNVSSYSKNATLAEEFVKFISNEENSKVRYEKTKEVPAVISLAESDEVKNSESASAIAEQSKYAALTPGITAMNAVWKPTDSALQTIATGKAKPQEALKTAAEQIKSAIAANQ